MSRTARIVLAALRVALGWLFFYAGIVKVMNPSWTAAGFLRGAKAFVGLYQWFALPANIGWVNVVNEWGLTLLGIALILGIGVRVASFLGVLLMALYYLPHGFPQPDATAYIVDEHVIYALVLCLLIAVRAGRTYGLDAWCARYFPRIGRIIGS